MRRTVVTAHRALRYGCRPGSSITALGLREGHLTYVEGDMAQVLRTATNSRRSDSGSSRCSQAGRALVSGRALDCRPARRKPFENMAIAVPRQRITERRKSNLNCGTAQEQFRGRALRGQDRGRLTARGVSVTLITVNVTSDTQKVR